MLCAMATRGPYAKGTAKREEILAVTLEVVADKGCRRTYVSEIAERAGLTQAGLMHYFRSREELYEEVLTARGGSPWPDAEAPASAVERFIAALEREQHVRGFVQLAVEFSAEASHPGHPSHGFFLRRQEEHRQALVAAIEAAQREGDVGPRLDAAAAADTLSATADGLRARWLLEPDLDVASRLRALWEQLRTASHPHASSHADACSAEARSPERAAPLAGA
ncbi:TetR family transcriptional regulator [Leifsonia sp. ku-ls]|nr:TetR family transcriptional regulator [Leifsonia sp. ku-ls]